jgi:hypothetical protein
MRRLGDHIFYLMLGIVILLVLAGCSTGPSAEPTACRGTNFQLNPPSSYPGADRTGGTP